MEYDCDPCYFDSSVNFTCDQGSTMYYFHDINSQNDRSDNFEHINLKLHTRAQTKPTFICVAHIEMPANNLHKSVNDFPRTGQLS